MCVPARAVAARDRYASVSRRAGVVVVCMEAHLSRHFPVVITRSPSRGRCVTAARAISAGAVVLACAPAAVFPLYTGPRCSHCFSEAARLGRCSGCSVAAYCGAACQKADWRAHRAECGAAAAWVWSGVFDRADAITAHLLSRLASGLGGLRTAKVHTRGPDPPPPHPRVYVHAWEDVSALCGSSADAAATAALGAVIDAATKAGLIPSGPALPSRDELLRVALALDANDFAVMDDLLAARASGVYPAAALLNHSCEPNCVVTFATAVDAARALDEDAGVPASDAAAPHRGSPAPTTLIMRAVRDVAEGEELCHTYADLALPSAARFSYLRGTYGFEPRATGVDEVIDAVLLGRAEPSDDAAPLAALARALPPRVFLGVPRPAGSANSTEAVELNVELLPAPPDAADAAPFAAAKDALRAALSLAVAGGAWGNAGSLEGDAGAALLAGAGVALSSFSKFLASEAQEGGGGDAPPLDAESATAISREEAALTAALRTLRALLAPLHVCTHGVVGAALTHHLLLGDLPAAAAACEHLVAFYRAVYSPRARAHPMLSLQLFTLGDLYSRLADAARSSLSGARPHVRPPRWALPDARAAELEASYVEDGGEGGAPRPAQRAIVREPVTPAAAARAAAEWATAARRAYTEAHAALRLSHGRAHALTQQAEELAEDAAKREDAVRKAAPA